MSDQEPVSELTPRPRRHDREAYERTASLYAELVHSPVRTLRENDLVVNQLPNVAEGTEMNLWFAVGHSIFIGDDQQYAADAMGIGLSGVIQKKMVVSRMRSRDLASGSGSGERHEATHTVDAGSLTADLWVTEQQTGCSVLILDWGRGQYSMVHLQPYDDEQFGGWGRSLMALGHYTCGLTSKTFFRSAYGTRG